MYDARVDDAARVHSSARPAVAGEGLAGYDASMPCSSSGELHQRLDDLEAAITALRAVHVGGVDDRDVAPAAVRIQELESRLDAVKLDLLAQAELTRVWAGDGAASLATWYAARTRLDPPVAAKQVRTAVRLRRFPELAAVLADGQITYDHAAAVTTAAIPRRIQALEAVQDTLVELARHAQPRDLRRVIERIRDVADPDGADNPTPLDETGPDERRELHLGVTINRLWSLRASLDVLTGEKLAALLDAWEVPDPPEVPEDQRRSAAQRRHDALDRLLDAMLALPDAPTVHGNPPHILATVDLAPLFGDDLDRRDADALAALLADPATTVDQLLELLGRVPTHGHTTHPEDHAADAQDPHDEAADPQDTHDASGPHEQDDGAAAGAEPGERDGSGTGPVGECHRPRLRYAGVVPPAVIRRLAHEAKITAVLTMGPWRIVNVGRTHRTLPPWLRGILHLRHGHCRGPDCTLPATWTQAHHADLPWADPRADTDLNHTVPLCQTHHDFLTTGTWAMTYDPDTAICTWTSPAGTIYRTHPPPP